MTEDAVLFQLYRIRVESTDTVHRPFLVKGAHIGQYEQEIRTQKFGQIVNQLHYVAAGNCCHANKENIRWIH